MFAKKSKKLEGAEVSEIKSEASLNNEASKNLATQDLSASEAVAGIVKEDLEKGALKKESKFLGSRRISRFKKNAEANIAKKTGVDSKIIFPAFAVLAALVVIVLVIAIIGAFRRPPSLYGLFEGDFKAKNVKEVQTYSTRTVRELGNPSHAFKIGEPILLKFEFKSDDLPESATYIVNDSTGKTVRTGNVTLSVKDNEDSVIRFISIVSSARTAIPEGKYVCYLVDSADLKQAHKYAKITFAISKEQFVKSTPTPTTNVENSTPIVTEVPTDVPENSQSSDSSSQEGASEESGEQTNTNNQ